MKDKKVTLIDICQQHDDGSHKSITGVMAADASPLRGIEVTRYGLHVNGLFISSGSLRTRYEVS